MRHEIVSEWTRTSSVLRDVGVTEFVRRHTDTSLLVLLGLLTQLGDVWFLFLLASSLYLWGPSKSNLGVSRENGAVVLGTVFLYIGLITLLKHAFLLPRPPGAMTPPPISEYHPLLRGIIPSLTTASTPGFPSGHALGSTLVYGTIASIITYSTRRNRWLVASSFIGIIGATRIGLGLHYLIDIIAGILIGLASILIVLRISKRWTDPTPVFLIAVILGGLGTVMTVSPMSVGALGGGLGGWITWTYTRPQSHEHTDHPVFRTELGLFAGVILLGGFIFWAVPGILGSFLTSIVLVGGILSVPQLNRRVTGSAR